DVGAAAEQDVDADAGGVVGEAGGDVAGDLRRAAADVLPDQLDLLAGPLPVPGAEAGGDLLADLVAVRGDECQPPARPVPPPSAGKERGQKTEDRGPKR